jgi:hypothetical protein
MGKINVGRVLLGGLVAGLLMNVGEIVLNDFVLGSRLKAFMDLHNFPDPGGPAIGIAVGLVFLLGIFTVLSYAAIRPRFGPGPKTAIIAALFVWFGVCFFTNVLLAGFGMIPADFLPILLPWGLVEYILAALAGAWLYKEA